MVLALLSRFLVAGEAVPAGQQLSLAIPTSNRAEADRRVREASSTHSRESVLLQANDVLTDTRSAHIQYSTVHTHISEADAEYQ